MPRADENCTVISEGEEREAEMRDTSHGRQALGREKRVRKAKKTH